MKKINKNLLKNITILFNKADDINLLADTDTQKAAEEIAATLSSKYSVSLLGINDSELNLIKSIKADLIFNLIEWSHIHLQDALTAISFLKKTGIPFTGSSEYGYELSSDKILMKKLMDENNIPTAKWTVLTTGNESMPSLTYPVIVKPTAQHCGIGISQDSLANSESEARDKAKKLMHEYNEPIIVEEFITGRELHVTILEKDGQPWVLPAAEVVFSQEEGFLPVLSYDAKWNEESEEYSKSSMEMANLSSALEKKVNQVAVDSFLKLGGHDYPRLDLRVRGEDLFVLEINNNPGIDYSDESGFGLSGKAAGFTYEEILSHIVENAYARFAQTAHDTITA